MAGTVAVVLGAAFGALVHALPGDRLLTTAVDDLVQLVAPLVASVLCATTARRATGPDRRLWWWLAAATASWAAGQTVWSWYELVLRRETPFPSPADAGFLAFPLLAATGLLLWHGGPYLSAGARDLIDGGLLAGALLMVSWKTALGAAMQDGAGPGLGFVLGLAYPVGDLVSATVVLLLVARTGVAARPHVALIAAGLLSLAVADSAYVYLLTVDGYSSGNAISAGWVTGFLLIGAAAFVGRDPGAAVDQRDEPTHGVLVLPYVAVAVALALVVQTALRGQVLSRPEVLLATALATLLLARQYLVVRDNDRLLREVRQREAALAHEVMHDGLTGLSNRAMLLQRLDQVVAGHRRHGRGLVVMFCDLDGFKAINDTYGHLAGDGVLREVALRLRAGVRSTDTVARPSGDEFAVLMEPPHDDPLRVAGRLISALSADVELPEGTVRTGVSIGIAVIPAGAPGGAVTSRSLIAAADSAMYSAKSGGKNRAVLVEVGVPGAARADETVGDDPLHRTR
ncbi:diguanylate cyclase domain-containing protein [Aquipuribacter hungaricus]|uniref:Diguanylate cyclase domain-containing protein n=1 Tax=Aquipuribacter hungaricus TaxID=545624 RepID=A0ABV7WHA5_9MICO